MEMYVIMFFIFWVIYTVIVIALFSQNVNGGDTDSTIGTSIVIGLVLSLGSLVFYGISGALYS